MEQRISALMSDYMTNIYFPNITVIDVLEVMILTFLIYKIIIWIKSTKAWMLLRGILVIIVFIFLAFIFQMNTILFLAKNTLTILATAALVVFQPELRRALERLGERNYFTGMVPFEKNKDQGRFSDKTLEGILDAVYSMSRVKTGALIVMEQATYLTEYESTGIKLDCIVSMQVLINIFEHNTPLHDGAIIIRDDRIMSATCYLPLSDNMRLSKELGTRHRAAVGMSENSDAFVIVVSEETGDVSVAEGGILTRGISREELKKRMIQVQRGNQKIESTRIKKWWKGRDKDEKKTD